MANLKGKHDGFDDPIGLTAALARLSEREVVPSRMSHREWLGVPQAVRERSFWAAGVANARLLQRMKSDLTDYLTQSTVTIGGRKVLKVGSRQEFIRRMIEFIEKEGIPRTNRGTVQDIGSSVRLRLIFDTQIKLHEGFGYWRHGMSPAILAAFPAMEFFRAVEVKKPRDVHERNLGAIRLKTDFKFWLAMNSPTFGGFGVPHGPWGFNSGCETRDKSAAEARRHGLAVDPAAPDQPKPETTPVTAFNELMTASVATLDKEMRGKLKTTFGASVTFKGDTAIFHRPGELSAAMKKMAAPPRRRLAPDQRDSFPRSLKRFPVVETKAGRTIVEEPATGRRFAIEEIKGEAAAKERIDMTNAYRAAGVAVPEARIVTGPFGRQVLATGVITGEVMANWIQQAGPGQRMAVEQLLAGKFAADVLFGNEDVLGRGLDGVTIDALGRPWRTDVSGAGRFRRYGQPKGRQFGPDATVELFRFRNPAANEDLAVIFSRLDVGAIKRQIAVLERRRQQILEAIKDTALRKLVAQRLDSLAAWRKQGQQP